MRLSREELLKKYPSWNEDRHDIVKVKYADMPLVHYDEKEYERYEQLTGTLANLELADAYIYSQNGTYDLYRTDFSQTYISENGKVLCGNINIKYRGQTYSVNVNNMYGWHGFYIYCIQSKAVKAFVSRDYPFSVVHNVYDEIDNDVVEKIINSKFTDYGIGVQTMMEYVRNTYAVDGRNYLEERVKEANDKKPKPVSNKISKQSYNEIKDALTKSISNYIDYGKEYDERKEMIDDAQLILDNLDNISTKVLEVFIFSIKTFDYPATVRHWMYDFRYFCIKDGRFLSLADQNDMLKHYPHFDASEKKPKMLGDYKC